MDSFHACLESVVSIGIQAYIGLLCCGEQERSKRLLSDALELSLLRDGGPSARFEIVSRRVGRTTTERDPGRALARTATAIVENDGAAAGSLARCIAFYTVRSLLASLLVLRATVYWQRVPQLEELRDACAELADSIEALSPTLHCVPG